MQGQKKEGRRLREGRQESKQGNKDEVSLGLGFSWGHLKQEVSFELGQIVTSEHRHFSSASFCAILYNLDYSLISELRFLIKGLFHKHDLGVPLNSRLQMMAAS